MNFLYLGCEGFPYGTAQVERQRLLAKSLVKIGHKVTIINRKGVHNPGKVNFSSRGNYQGIDYIYTSGNIYRAASFPIRNIQKLRGWIGEFFFIVRLRFRSKIDAAILSSMIVSQVVYYALLARLFGFKLILDYVEMNAAIESSSVKMRFNHKYFDHLAPKKTDSIICISNYLQNHVRKVNPSLPTIKIPIICDYKEITAINVQPSGSNYFLYCGTLAYLEVIVFVLEAYALCSAPGYALYLIVNGDTVAMNKLQRLLDEHPNKASIKIYSQLTYEDLVKFYKQARALLIPLRPTIQDEARFPHKIGEYTASGRPVITTLYGEVKYFFKDMENAFIAEHYDSRSFAAKMNYVTLHPEIADTIGKKGQELCQRNFDYPLFGTRITNLVQSLSHKKLSKIKTD